MSRRSLSLAGSTILLVAALGAPVAADERAPEPALTIDCDTFAAQPAAVASVDVLTGSAVVVSLCSNPTTGFTWSEPVTSDATVAVPGSWSFTAPTGDTVGASGTQQLSIAGVAPGTAVLTASYDQPWEGGTKGAWSLELTVNVHDGATLTIDCDAFMATPAMAQAIEATAGSQVIVSLCSNPTTGFRWSDALSSDPSIASVSGWSFEPSSSEMTGASGMEHLTIDVNAPGTAVLTASYDQPWDGGTKGAWSLELTITVR